MTSPTSVRRNLRPIRRGRFPAVSAVGALLIGIGVGVGVGIGVGINIGVGIGKNVASELFDDTTPVDHRTGVATPASGESSVGRLRNGSAKTRTGTRKTATGTRTRTSDTISKPITGYPISNEMHKLRHHGIYRKFGCKAALKKPRPIYSAERWRELRDFYNQFVIDDLAASPLEEGEPVRTYKFSDESFDTPARAAVMEHMGGGRGLVASHDIPKGGEIFRGTNDTLIFNSGRTFRSLMFSIHAEFVDPDVACDLLSWAWVQDMDGDGRRFGIAIDVDITSLLNSGSDGDENIRCGRKGEKCGWDYYATRNIKMGEEVLCDYSDFALGSWSDFGL